MTFARRPPPAATPPRGWHALMRDSMRGSRWYLRLPLWAYLAYVGVRQFLDPTDYASWFSALNLCIHEGGHVVCRGMGDTIHIAAGTLAQLAAPIAAMFILGRQRDYFGITFALGWLSTNLISIGIYMADARARELPLFTAEAAGSTEAQTQHDWAYLFGQTGLMEYDTTIGFATRALASAVMLLALAAGAWMMVEMVLANRSAFRLERSAD